ncbi:MAG: hypothetical protein WCR72_10210 [Bacteroidota bacterium]
MRILLIILFVFPIFCFNCFAKEKYKDGYIITLKGDTVVGSLQIQNSNNASQVCIFENRVDGQVLKYKPGEIYGYRFTNGKFYISKEIVNALKNEKETFFLEFLIQGIANMYYLNDNEGDHYYIEKSFQGLIELTEPEKYVQTEEGIRSVPSKYKGKLKSLLSDCSGIESEINKTSLDHSSLIKLAKDYHQKVCTTDSCIIYERKDIPVKLMLGIVAGYGLNQYNFGNKLQSDYGSAYQIGIKLSLRNILFSDERYEVNFNCLLEKDSKYNLTKDFSKDSYNEPVIYQDQEYSVNSSGVYNATPKLGVKLNIISIRFPIVVNYKYSFTNFRFFVGGGFDNKIIVSQNKQFKYLSFYEQYGKSMNPILIGAIGNLGFEYGLKNNHLINLSTSFNYLTDPTAVNTYLRLTSKEWGFTVSYIF